MTNLTEIQLSKEVEIARLFISHKKPNKSLTLEELQEIAERKNYFFGFEALKIALN